MLVLADLDNTLVDREAAFAQWAAVAVRRWGGDAADTAWIIGADARGYTPRTELAQAVVDRLDPVGLDRSAVEHALLYEHVAHVACFAGVLDALAHFAAAGVPVIVVTNGESRQQRMKLEGTGLTSLLAGSIISGEVGVAKPDPAIFALARTLAPNEGPVWMVGDHPVADIAGARDIGLRTAWISHGHPWVEKTWRPDLIADDTAEALRLILRGSSEGGPAVHGGTLAR